MTGTKESFRNVTLCLIQGVLFDAGQQLLLATNNHTSVIKAGEKPKNKYKEAAEVEGWGEVNSLEVLQF